MLFCCTPSSMASAPLKAAKDLNPFKLSHVHVDPFSLAKLYFTSCTRTISYI